MLADLADLYQHRDRAARAWQASGGKIVGYVGTDTPLELIEAAGMLPVRVCGDPRGGTDLAERYLGTAGDPIMRSQLNRLLDGTYAFVDFLVIARDTEGMVLLFQTLRELQRVEPRADFPPFCLVDVLHLPYRTSQLYVRDEFRRLQSILSQWRGQATGDAELGAAIATRNQNRALLRELALLRVSGRVSGVQALQAIGAGMVMPVREHTQQLRGTLAELSNAQEQHGRRVFLTGSEHEYTDVYEVIESSGGLVVGEDHDWGNRAFADVVEENGDPIDALADAYQLGAPASAKYGIAERAAYTAEQARATGAELVIAFVRTGDESPLWDIAQQRAALAKHGIPLSVLTNQPYGNVEQSELQAALHD